MHRFLLLAATVVLVAAGCAGDDGDSDSAAEEPPPAATTTAPTPTIIPPAATDTEPSADPGRTYTRRELPRLALQPSDAPRGMRYTKAESGPKTLDQIGVLLDVQTKELRSLGFRAVYDAIFDSTRSDLRLASRIWLFKATSGAQRWLDRTESNSLAVALQPLSAPQLGDGSWAAGGNLNGNDLITHAFRSGNVVVVQTLSTQSVRLAASDALIAAQKAAARFRQT